jgi:hypothetical protein
VGSEEMLAEARSEFAILSRACGNWREWPKEAVSSEIPDYTHDDWKAAAKAIFERNEFREKVAQWMIENGFATGHGDTIDDLLKELTWQIAELRAPSTKDLSPSEG